MRARADEPRAGVCTHARTHARTPAHMYMRMYVCVCTYVCVYVCMACRQPSRSHPLAATRERGGGGRRPSFRSLSRSLPSRLAPTTPCLCVRSVRHPCVPRTRRGRAHLGYVQGGHVYWFTDCRVETRGGGRGEGGASCPHLRSTAEGRAGDGTASR
ncbi:hypothetical protein GGS23DRAFT_549120 [Durotheca rogersii]|uniref:uncharacterized protein n=1 Tax=Durotheca rogersii TaxID=419775 RepID=UPI00221FAF48|nr:uncharacterized protein GGS23DRAFT_549120 [Durotheca rogersii]KAI5867601.1 hypothetical protein GGS23DRAFT_549120 [Durotheca rogersii]